MIMEVAPAQIDNHQSQKEDEEEGDEEQQQLHQKQSKDEDDEEDENNNVEDGSDTMSSSFETHRLWNMRRISLIMTGLVLVLGLATTATFLAFGIISTLNLREEEFASDAKDLMESLKDSWRSYVNAASLVHNRCKSRNFTRVDFRDLYEYLISNGLDFKAVQFYPHTLDKDRKAMEDSQREYLAKHYPHVTYKGFTGFNYDNSTSLEPRIQQPSYLPVHYMEPILGNEAAIDLDFNSSVDRKNTVKSCFDNGAPALSRRLALVKDENSKSRCGPYETDAYGLVLIHPGVNVTSYENSTSPNPWPRDVAAIVVCVPALLKRATDALSLSSEYIVYMHDMIPGIDPEFLGAVRTKQNGETAEFLPEVPWDDNECDSSHTRKHRSHCQRHILEISNRTWTVTIHDTDDSVDERLIYIVIAGLLIALASFLLCCFIFQNSKRIERIHRLKRDNEAEKASLILSHAQEAAKAERELNDFISHEVRNPVAAAMAANSFVRSALKKKQPFDDAETLRSIREDAKVVDTSLKFINDLLRTMLDMHRASNAQMVVEFSPANVLHDIIQPVQGMLCQIGSDFDILVDCPGDLVVETDALRLQQVVLNLGRNSAKFVNQGFVRFVGKVDKENDSVQLCIEDSGLGIPREKKGKLFHKFQESLDALNQGTGVGLFLCKCLTDLLGGDIYLDDGYDSGIPGHPGARFVVDLHTAPLQEQQHQEHPMHQHQSDGRSSNHSQQPQLPEDMSVLFVDDDKVLRKLFSRTLKKVAPSWIIREAASGEACILLAKESHFDLIFVDMYMASVERTLLGTETVAELRNMGITARICGLSANDKEKEFLESGADGFVMKPFPCETVLLTRELCRVLYGAGEKPTSSCQHNNMNHNGENGSSH